MRISGKSLNRSQVLLLQALAASKGGMTRSQLAEASGANPNADNLGATYREDIDSYPHSLRALKMVVVEKADEDAKCLWTVTAAGRKAAEKYRTIDSVTRGVKVDVNSLDNAVIAFRSTRTYCMESWTAEDIQMVRDAAGIGHDVSDDSIRQVVINRRKQGYYSDPDAKRIRAARAAIHAFGPTGEVEAGIIKGEALAALKKIAGF